MADEYTEATRQPEPEAEQAVAPEAHEGSQVVPADADQVTAPEAHRAPGPQLTDEQDPDLEDEEVALGVVDEDEAGLPSVLAVERHAFASVLRSQQPHW